MVTLSAETPLGKLEFTHAGGKVTVKGPSIALAEWNHAVARRPLYGPFGHIFNPNICLISDLTCAIQDFAGEESITIPEHIKEQIKLEMQDIPGDGEGVT